MARVTTFAGPNPGFGICNEDATMQLASGLTCAKGDVMAVDMSKVDTSLRFYEIRAPVTADFQTASTAQNLWPYMCVCLEAQTVAAGQVRVRFAGDVDALIEDASLAIGAKLQPKNASRALDTGAAAAGTGNRVVAVAKHVTAANTVGRVEFDGISGVYGGSMITNTT